MNDKNFDSLKNLKAPESWIENAMQIPKLQEKKPIFFIRYSRSLMAVACLVLVCAVSLIIVLQKDDGKILVVDPDFQTTATEHHTEKESTEKTESLTDNKENNTQTKKENAPIQNTKTENGGAPHEDTQNAVTPTHSGNTQETENPTSVIPTDSPIVETENEYIDPTQSYTEPMDGSEADVYPTVRPTTVKPTKPPIKPVNKPQAKPQAPESSMPPDEGYNPPPSIDETISQPMGTSFYVYKPCGTTFYCVMFDPDGKMLGDDDLFSEKRKTVLLRDYPDFYILNYYPEHHYKLTKLGRYTYLLYDENGKLLQQTYIEAEY